MRGELLLYNWQRLTRIQYGPFSGRPNNDALICTQWLTRASIRYVVWPVHSLRPLTIMPRSFSGFRPNRTISYSAFCLLTHAGVRPKVGLIVRRLEVAINKDRPRVW